MTTSVNELADIITELMEGLYDRKIKAKHVEPPKWRKEMKEEFDYSIGKLKKELDYEPQFSLRTGIKEPPLDFRVIIWGVLYENGFLIGIFFTRLEK